MELVVLTAILVGGFLLIARHAMRAHTVVELAHGRARVLRGTLPPGLLGDLGAIARHESGTVELRGGGPTLKIDFEGLSDGGEQRVRNVVLLVKDRIKP